MRDQEIHLPLFLSQAFNMTHERLHDTALQFKLSNMNEKISARSLRTFKPRDTMESKKDTYKYASS